MQAKIHKLSEEVINKIAAGEVVQRPYSVVKELIENSIDAGSTVLTITIQQGGLKLINIQDNGSGIHCDDYPLLCERFATSKIKSSSDIQNINSFGFRGEALASISFCSVFSATSRQASQEYGYQASYKDGKLEGEPIITTMEPGTIMTVKDLFYNMQSRRKSLSITEERKIVIKLVQSLALHYCNVGFTLKSDNQVEFNTQAIQFTSSTQNGNLNGITQKNSTNSISTNSTNDSDCSSKDTTQSNSKTINSTSQQQIKEARCQIMNQIFKVNANNFLQITFQQEVYNISVDGIFSKISGAKNKREVIIFINNRLVDCDSLKRAIDRAYQQCYQAIHESEGGYCCYISLSMKPEKIDPNVHPCKREVKFAFEYEIANEIEKYLFNSLSDTCSIKCIQQSDKNSKQQILFQQKMSKEQVGKNNNLISNIAVNGLCSNKINNNVNGGSNINNNMYFIQNSKQTLQQNKVRVDPKMQTIDKFIQLKENQCIPSGINQLTLPNSNAIIFNTNLANLEQPVNDGEQEEEQKVNTANNNQIFTNNLNNDIQIRRTNDIQNSEIPFAIIGNNVIHQNLDQQQKFQIQQLQETKTNNAYDLTAINTIIINKDALQNGQCNNQEAKGFVQERYEMVKILKQRENRDITNFFHNLSYVGCISSNYFIAQKDKSLYLINSVPFCLEAFQLWIIHNLTQLKYCSITEKLSLQELMEQFLKIFDGIEEKQRQMHLEKQYVEKLQSNSDFLRRFFSIRIIDGRLEEFPILFDKFSPLMSKKDISYFFLKLATKVDFTQLQSACLQIARELSFYFAWRMEHVQENGKFLDEQYQPYYDEFFKNTLLPEIKKKCFFPQMDLNKFTYKILCLDDIYKIFERC